MRDSSTAVKATLIVDIGAQPETIGKSQVSMGTGAAEMGLGAI